MKMTHDQKELLDEMRRQVQNDDYQIFEILQETKNRGVYRYDPIYLNKTIMRKTKMHALENLENNPIIKAAIN